MKPSSSNGIEFVAFVLKHCFAIASRVLAHPLKQIEAQRAVHQSAAVRETDAVFQKSFETAVASSSAAKKENEVASVFTTSEDRASHYVRSV